MQLLCWNMSGPLRAGSVVDLHEAAWHWIAALQPDVALLQETHVPVWARDHWTVIAEPQRDIDFGTVLLARPGVGLRPLPGSPRNDILSDRLTATAELDLGDGTSMVLASVSGDGWLRQTSLPATPPSSPDVEQPGDALLEAFGDLVAGRRFLVGGDLEIARYLDAPQPVAEDAAFFDRVAAAGWVELSLDADGREGRTWFGSRAEAMFQPDHVFGDAETRSCRTAFEIDSWPAAKVDLSDHAALVLILDIDLSPVPGEPEWDPDMAYIAERFHKTLWLEDRKPEEQRRESQGRER